MLNPNTAGEKLQSTSYQRIRNRIHLKQAKQKAYTDNDRSAVYRSFQPGDWVMVKRPHTGHKLKLKLSEPIQVQRKLAEFSYRLQDGSRWHVDALVGTNVKLIKTQMQERQIPYALGLERKGTKKIEENNQR